MALSDNPFIGIALAQLIIMQQQWLQVLSDIASVGQSYTFPNRSLTKADMPMVLQVLNYLRIAVAQAQPTGSGTGGKQMVQAVIDTQCNFST